MGIYDRDYYRNDGPGIFDSLMPSGAICRWLIGINVAVFFLQIVTSTSPSANDGWVTEGFVLDTHAVLEGQVWRLLSYAFLHATDTPFHILFNMLFLWWFGSDLEIIYGRREFLAIYLVSALCGGVAFELWGILQDRSAFCLGASGAVTTMLCLYACHFPRRVIYVFMILPMPIWLFAVFNIVQDSFILLSGQQSRVAVIVHLAGAGFALMYFYGKWSLSHGWQTLLGWKQAQSRPRLKLFDPAPQKEEPVAVSASSTASMAPVVMDEHLEAKLDAVLEKIARKGKDSLTEQEQQILKQAAEMYKRRRS